MEVPQKRWMVYFMENPIFKIDDLGIPLFRETPRIIYLIIAQLPDHHRISSFPAPIWTVPNLVVWHPVEVRTVEKTWTLTVTKPLFPMPRGSDRTPMINMAGKSPNVSWRFRWQKHRSKWRIFQLCLSSGG